mmetsp:Transcript_65/g.108  ORF Transcript_65/g.108 Transcript_65/m.108 type:complete len:119 (+) Transcript_65:865-1221(+)
MGQPQRRKKTTAKDKSVHRAVKNKHYQKDIDQIHKDLEPQNHQKLTNQEIDEELPGQGQHYCVPCARYFINQSSLTQHYKTKPHKKRLKALKEQPYSQEEAERCAGMTKPSRDITMKS